MARASYEDWTAEVHDELRARNLDIQTAYDWYSFHTAYHEFHDKPRKAVEDYENWFLDNGEFAE